MHSANPKKLREAMLRDDDEQVNKIVSEARMVEREFSQFQQSVRDEVLQAMAQRGLCMSMREAAKMLEAEEYDY